jgi:hypothetical protein
MKKSTAKATRRPAKRRELSPVIAGRVPASLHRQIKEAAKKSGRSMSEEQAWRVAISFEWERAFGEAKKWLADQDAVLQRGYRAALQQMGCQRISIDQGVIWAEPGTSIARLSLSVDAAAIANAMQPELTELVVRVLKKVSTKEDRS